MGAFDNLKIDKPKKTLTKSHVVKTIVNVRKRLLGLENRVLKPTKAKHSEGHLKLATVRTSLEVNPQRLGGQIG